MRFGRRKADVTLRAERLRAASNLMVAEYSALKAEQLQALTSAQSSVRWSLSTFGVLFAAGLVATYQTTNATQANPDFLNPLILLVFGFVFPGFCCLGAWTWLADHARYERVSSHIRGLELRASVVPDLVELNLSGPLRSERFKAESRRAGHPEARFGRQRMANLSTAGVYFGAIFTSELVFLIWHAHVYARGLDVVAILWLSLAGAVFVLFLAVSFILGWQIQTLRIPTPSLDLDHERTPTGLE